MALNFKKFAKDGDTFISKLSRELSCSKEMAGRILKATMHSLRKRLSPDESIQLMAQLPMFLKAVYVEGWKLNEGKDRIKHLSDFIDDVKSEDYLTADFDFGDNKNSEAIINTVFDVLRMYISDGEMDDIKAQLPKELKPLVNKRITIKKLNKSTSIG